MYQSLKSKSGESVSIEIFDFAEHSDVVNLKCLLPQECRIGQL
jgi:hypothetical protein